MPTGGKLILKTRNASDFDMRDKVYKPQPGRYVLLTVRDTGSGMDKKTMERIYDPFFTTKDMNHGTGLGLASAYGIIKGHGGYIDVCSSPGAGCTFSVYLPASEKRNSSKVVNPESEMVRGCETVLLVDDEETVRQVSEDLLKAMGYQMLSAADGNEALEIYTRHGQDIAVVLLDMVMPMMGGGEVYDRLKGIDPNVKVLLLSGYSLDGEASKILRRGCNGFIQKPFDVKELSKKLRSIIDA
jgi:CheY-like chemotaxis protein